MKPGRLALAALSLCAVFNLGVIVIEPAPGGGGGWATNEPPGFVALGTWSTAPTFGSLTEANRIDDADDFARVATVTDATAPGADTSVVRITYPGAGTESPEWYGSGAPARWKPLEDFDTGGGATPRRIYVRAWVKFGDASANWTNGCNAGTKLMFLRTTIQGETNHYLNGVGGGTSGCFNANVGTGELSTTASGTIVLTDPADLASVNVGDQIQIANMGGTYEYFWYGHVTGKPSSTTLEVTPFDGFEALYDFTTPNAPQIYSTPPDATTTYSMGAGRQDGDTGDPNPLSSQSYVLSASGITANEWQQYEIVVDTGTAGNADGELTAYLNGVEVYSDTAQQWLDADDTPGWAFLWIDPTYGGGYFQPPATQYLYLDEIYVSYDPSLVAGGDNDPPTTSTVLGYESSYCWDTYGKVGCDSGDCIGAENQAAYIAHVEATDCGFTSSNVPVGDHHSCRHTGILDLQGDGITLECADWDMSACPTCGSGTRCEAADDTCDDIRIAHNKIQGPGTATQAKVVKITTYSGNAFRTAYVGYNEFSNAEDYIHVEGQANNDTLTLPGEPWSVIIEHNRMWHGAQPSGGHNDPISLAGGRGIKVWSNLIDGCTDNAGCAGGSPSPNTSNIIQDSPTNATAGDYDVRYNRLVHDGSGTSLGSYIETGGSCSDDFVLRDNVFDRGASGTWGGIDYSSTAGSCGSIPSRGGQLCGNVYEDDSPADSACP